MHENQNARLGESIDAPLLRGECETGRYQTILSNLELSKSYLLECSKRLAEELGEPSVDSPAIAVSGSLGRLEASGESDIDLVIMYPGELPRNHPEWRQHVLRTLSDIPIPHEGKQVTLAPPNAKGVFRSPLSIQEVIGKIGRHDENYQHVSIRLLLLLECRALWNHSAFEQHLYRLISSYGHRIEEDPSKHYVMLLNDLIRYFRGICIHYHSQFSDASEWGKWPMRNIKLRHSRVLIYMSLLIVLGELSKHEYRSKDKNRHLFDFIRLPPLERFVDIYNRNGDDNLFRVMGCYNLFLQKMSNSGTRRKLQDLEYNARYTCPEFSLLKANSDAFAAELTRFVAARKGAWSDRFYEYLLL